MICQRLSRDNDVKSLILAIGSTVEGAKIMAKKAKMNYFYIKQIKTPAANILKQDALSIGGDFAVPKGVITNETKFVDGVLIITNDRLQNLITKLTIQPFGLKELSEKLKSHLVTIDKRAKIMGVLNVNEDSFFSGSRFVGKKAIDRIEKMLNDGADIIDVGGVSSRPGSESISDNEELSRVKPIIDEIYNNRLYEKAIFSLDSYSPICLEHAFNHGFKIANDITALRNDEVAKICAKYSATVCLMHMQNNPKTMQQEPKYKDVINEVDEFFAQRIKKAKKFGINDLILDVGVGFGKSLEHNLKLIKSGEHFLHYGYELLVGASRKSLIDKITPTAVNDRLSGSLILHIEALRYGASIIRCHDVKEHFQALKVYEELMKTVG